MKNLSSLRYGKLADTQRERLASIDTRSITGCVDFLNELISGVVRGDIDSRAAQLLVGAVRSQAAILEGQELERRVEQLEELFEASDESDSTKN